jgi:hypothetical protein
MATQAQYDRVTTNLIKDLLHMLEKQNPQLVEQEEPKKRGPKPRSFADRFRADLQRDTVTPSYEAVYEMMVNEVGEDIDNYIKQHGLDARLYAAILKTYYSKEGSEVRNSLATSKA